MRRLTFVLLLIIGIFSNQSVFGREDQETSSAKNEKKVIVYYLHNTFRCVSCNVIEGLTKVAVLGGEFKNSRNGKTITVKPKYKALIEEKKLIFKSVNVDKKNNKYLIKDFKGEAKYPLIVEMKNGKVLLPAYHELAGIFSEVLILDNSEKFSTKSG